MSRRLSFVLPMVFFGISWPGGGIQAQACIGVPQGSKGSFAFTLGFPEDARSYGLSGVASTDEGSVFFGGNFGIVSPDQEGLENQKQVGGALVYEIESLTPEASLCPMIGANYAWVEDVKAWSVPFGVALGKTLRLEGGGTALTPYVMPQFLFEEVGIDEETENDWFFGLSAGATFSFTHFFVGGFVSKIFEEGADAVFAAQVGLAWR